jgi:hypothetical protein
VGDPIIRSLQAFGVYVCLHYIIFILPIHSNKGINLFFFVLSIKISMNYSGSCLLELKGWALHDPKPLSIPVLPMNVA